MPVPSYISAPASPAPQQPTMGEMVGPTPRTPTISAYASPYTPFGPAPTESETLEEAWNPVQDLVSPALIRRLAMGLGGLLVGAVHFGDIPAAQVGLQALRRLPLRLQTFLLKHPESIEVGSASATEMFDLAKALGMKAGRFPAGSFSARAGTAEAPHVIKLLPGFADEAFAAEELLHASDFLKSHISPSVGSAIEAQAARPVREVLKDLGYSKADLPAETFGALSWAASRDPARRAALFQTLRSPEARQQFLDVIENVNPTPLAP